MDAEMARRQADDEQDQRRSHDMSPGRVIDVYAMTLTSAGAASLTQLLIKYQTTQGCSRPMVADA